MSHTQNLRRMSREYLIDLYLHPPVSGFRILDYHLVDRIVRDSNRCASILRGYNLKEGVFTPHTYLSPACLCSLSVSVSLPAFGQ